MARELNRLEKGCIIELINELYACTENTFSDCGLKPEDALTQITFMLNSDEGADLVWANIISKDVIWNEAGYGTETKHIRYCGKNVVKSFIKSYIEKEFPYSNTSLSKDERLAIFSKAWMF